MPGSDRLDDEDLAMGELMRAIELGDVHQRTAATLTLLKLCRCKSPSNLLYVVDHELLRFYGSRFLFAERGPECLHDAIGEKGDFAAGGVRVSGVSETRQTGSA